jgi:hypothetical protein
VHKFSKHSFSCVVFFIVLDVNLLRNNHEVLISIKHSFSCVVFFIVLHVHVYFNVFEFCSVSINNLWLLNNFVLNTVYKYCYDGLKCAVTSK